MLIPPSKLPVTVLTGFLGSGKTTLLQKILKENHHQRIAIIENEYGSVGIDHHLIQHVDENVVVVQNGCVCCSIRTDLVDAILSLHKRRDWFDSIVIETTGLADPVPITQTLLSDPKLKDIVSLQAIITVVDAEQFELNNSDKLPEFQSQIAFADLIVVSKTDIVGNEQVEIIEARLRKLNGLTNILRANLNTAPISEIFGISLFSKRPMKFTAVKSTSLPEPHQHTPVFSRTFEIDGLLDGARLEVFLGMFLQSFGKFIFRMKGIVKVPGETKPILIQVVRHVVNIEPIGHEIDEIIVNRFVIIASSDFFFNVFEEWLMIAKVHPEWREKMTEIWSDVLEKSDSQS